MHAAEQLVGFADALPLDVVELSLRTVDQVIEVERADVRITVGTLLQGTPEGHLSLDAQGEHLEGEQPLRLLRPTQLLGQPKGEKLVSVGNATRPPWLRERAADATEA